MTERRIVGIHLEAELVELRKATPSRRKALINNEAGQTAVCYRSFLNILGCPF